VSPFLWRFPANEEETCIISGQMKEKSRKNEREGGDNVLLICKIKKKKKVKFKMIVKKLEIKGI
jgi:hypothetical protein